MDVSALTRLEPAYSKHYAYKAASNPQFPYHHSSFVKPLFCRPHLGLTRKSKALVLPKVKILSELLENEARASTNYEETMHTYYLGKVRGKINHVNGGANVNNRNSTNGNGGANEQIMEKAIKVLSQANSIVSKEETGTQCSTQACPTSTMQDANKESKKIVQGFYQPSKEGLGIVEFLKGKNLLITGATGFLGKVLVEKILRVQPNVGQIFLLIQGKDTNHAKERLQDEIICSQLFNNLKSHYGDSYQQFMEKKLTSIVGNLATNNLGMDMNTMETLQRKLDIIINSAASTTFDERYDHALTLNTRGAQRTVEFGRSCLRLQLLMHVSTAFVNGERKGVSREEPFDIGYSISNETLNPRKAMAPDISVERESIVVKKRMENILNNNQSLKSGIPPSNEKQNEKKLKEAMKELGMERAKWFGWQDTYVFTKAMGEMLVDSTRGQLPIVIVRPSVVESSLKDPFPGWIEGNRMMDPIIISYGKGRLPGFLADPKGVLDVVPVDMVANAMLAAMAKHASTPGLEVYQVASAVVNPFFFADFAKLSFEHFKEHPFKDMAGNICKPTNNFELFKDMETFMDAVTFSSNFLKDEISSSTNAISLLKRHNQLTLKVRQQASYLANIYQPYTFYAGSKRKRSLDLMCAKLIGKLISKRYTFQA